MSQKVHFCWERGTKVPSQTATGIRPQAKKYLSAPNTSRLAMAEDLGAKTHPQSVDPSADIADKKALPPLESPGRSYLEHAPQHQAQIERARVNQDPLPDVLPPSSVRPPHTPCLIQMRKRPLNALDPPSPQSLALGSPHPPLIPTNRLLLRQHLLRTLCAHPFAIRLAVDCRRRLGHPPPGLGHGLPHRRRAPGSAPGSVTARMALVSKSTARSTLWAMGVDPSLLLVIRASGLCGCAQSAFDVRFLRFGQKLPDVVAGIPPNDSPHRRVGFAGCSVHAEGLALQHVQRARRGDDAQHKPEDLLMRFDGSQPAGTRKGRMIGRRPASPTPESGGRPADR